MSRIKVLAIIGGLVGISSAVLIAWVLLSKEADVSEKVQLGLRLARGGDYTTAARIVEPIKEAQIKKRVDKSTRHFLMGAAARQAAESLSNRPSRMEKNEEAAAELQKSRELKFPPGYEGLGNYLLGIALYDLMRWEEAIAPLSIAFDRWPRGRSDAVERLIDIDLYGSSRDPDSALRRLERWSALSALAPSDVDRIASKRMEIHCETKQYDQLVPLWRSISIESPRRSHADLTLARALRQQALEPNSESSAMRKEALENLKEIESLENVPNPIRRQAMLEQGLIYRDAGALKQAISTLSSLRLSSPFEPEFMIAGIEEIEMQIGLDEHPKASATLEQLTKNFKNPQWYENPSMPLTKMRLRLLASANRLLEKGDYAEAARFVDDLPNVCSEVDRLRLEASIHDRWGRKLQQGNRASSEGERSNFKIEKTDGGEVEQIFRRAAQSIERLSQIDMRTPNYMERLWWGIEDYHFSGRFLESNRLIDRYLDLAPRSDHSRPMLMRAKNYAAAGKTEDALVAINNLLLMTPATPLLPDAKLTAAKLQWSLGNFEAAESLIVDNLYSGSLRPDSPIWKESLIELGTLMFRQGEQMQVRILGLAVEEGNQPQGWQSDLEKSYQQLLRSIASMEEGLRRFQGDARRYELLYMTAKAYRMASYWPETLLRGNRLVSEESISQWKGKRKELLIHSRDTFAALRRELTMDKGKVRIPNSEMLLCNSYFGEADLLFQEGNFKGALEAYRSAANQFINEPESLEAFVQMARCHQELGQISEMRRTLEMAIDILGRIPADRDSRFLKNTRESRQEWESRIRWMLQEIDQGSIR
ncbi:MAG: tetratricopeptide repeat protein [Planctomycetota bacterium]